MDQVECYHCTQDEGGKNPYCPTYIDGRKTGLISAGQACHWAGVVQSDLEKLARGDPNITFTQLKNIWCGQDE